MCEIQGQCLVGEFLSKVWVIGAKRFQQCVDVGDGFVRPRNISRKIELLFCKMMIQINLQHVE